MALAIVLTTESFMTNIDKQQGTMQCLQDLPLADTVKSVKHVLSFTPKD